LVDSNLKKGSPEAANLAKNAWDASLEFLEKYRGESIVEELKKKNT
jgi:hypothetical protein